MKCQMHFWKATGVFMLRDSILLCEEKDDLLPFEMSRLVPNMKQPAGTTLRYSVLARLHLELIFPFLGIKFQVLYDIEAGW